MLLPRRIRRDQSTAQCRRAIGLQGQRRDRACRVRAERQGGEELGGLYPDGWHERWNGRFICIRVVVVAAGSRGKVTPTLSERVIVPSYNATISSTLELKARRRRRMLWVRGVDCPSGAHPLLLTCPETS